MNSDPPCLSIDVLMIVKNEEVYIGSAIDSVKAFAKNVIIVDSGSEDRTVEIAQSKGAIVVFHKFLDFGDQWNYAINALSTGSDWQMKLDPDERISEASIRELSSIISNAASEVAGISFTRQLQFLGSALPVKQSLVRVWRKGRCKFSEVRVNEQPIIDGTVVDCKCVLTHLDSLSFETWLAKQNFYTSLEVEAYINDRYSVTPAFFGNALERRIFFKRIFFKIPFRYFLYKYFLIFRHLTAFGDRNFLCWVEARIMVFRILELKIFEFKKTQGDSLSYKRTD